MNAEQLALVRDSDLYSVQHRFRTDVFEIFWGIFLSPLNKFWNLSTRTTCSLSDEHKFTKCSPFCTKYIGAFAAFPRIILHVAKYRSAVPSL
jgi:hypothetical protein